MAEESARPQTGLVIAAMLGICAATVPLASFQYVLVDMQREFAFSTDTANGLAFMPSAASLIVVFIAGALADRWGPRRLFIISILLFQAGALLVAVAPSMSVVIAGRILDGVGGVTIAIVALAIVNSAVTEPDERARVFGIYAAVTPATFLLAPLVAAWVVQVGGWRAGMLPGILFGCGALVLGLRHIPRQEVRPTGELLTPVLAGVVLAGIALGVTSAPTSLGLALTCLALGLAALVVLLLLLRRMHAPSLDLRWCRERGMVLLLFALCFAAMPNLFFYTNLLLQYRYGVPLILIASLLTFAQASAILGGLLSGPISTRIGAAPAATAALFVSAGACLSTLFVTTSAPIWVPVLVLAISAGPFTFVIGPMTNTVMSASPEDASGAASSMRKATWTIGNVLGGAFIGAMAFRAFEVKLAQVLTVDGLPSQEALIVSKEIRDGAVVDDLAARITEPLAHASLIDKGPGLLEAQSFAFTVMGLLTAALYFTAGLLMLLYLRRTRQSQHLEGSV